MKRWRVPIIYFALCESLWVLHELALVQILPWVGMIGIFVLLALTFPAMSLGHWVELHAAAWLNLPFDFHTFWPRMLSMQAMILACTIVVALITWILSSLATWWRARQ